MKDKYTQLLYDMMENKGPTDIYQLVLSGKLKKFPNNFWAMPENYKWAGDCTRYLLENILGWNDTDIRTKLAKKTFTNNKLTGMLIRVFKSSPYAALNNAYPDKYKPWELSNVPLSYWTQETAMSAMTEIFETRLGWTTDDQFYDNFSIDLFEKFKLIGMLNILKLTPYKMLELVYPNRFNFWRFKYMKYQSYSIDDKIFAVRWLIDDRLKLDKDTVCNSISYKLFKDNGLDGLIRNSDNIFSLLELAYPGKYKPWELSSLLINYWTNETSSDAIRWLIEEKLKWTRDEVCKNFRIKLLSEYRLSFIAELFNSNTFNIINNAYPGVYKPWEFSRVSKDYWNNETIRDTVKWLIEEKLKWTREDICTKLSHQLFRDHKLSSILEFPGFTTLFSIIDIVYPNEYKP